MKVKISIIIILFLILGITNYYYIKSVESNKNAIKLILKSNVELQNIADNKRDSLITLEIEDGNIQREKNKLEDDIQSAINLYKDKLKFVEHQEEEYKKSLDQDDSGTPDFIEQGDFNGNGIPDAVEH